MLLSTSELIKKYDLQTKKSLGQNFILDKNFTDKIARSANTEKSGFLKDFSVLEIGAGPGSLTRSILDAGAKKLVVIEKDERCIELLKELQEFYGFDRLQVINGDALEIDETKILDQPFKIVANLPYNVATVLLVKWLKLLSKNPNQIKSMHLMVQKEVAQRISSKVNENHFGRLAVMTGFLAQSKILFDVARNVFTPPPKVTSAIIEILPFGKPLFDIDFADLEKVVAVAFNQRRKMIRSSLKPLFQGLDVELELKELTIDASLRAENLTIEQFCKITKHLKKV